MENHILTVEGRERITVTAVTDVDNFNEESILIKLTSGRLVIKGQKLHVQSLDLGEGKVVITGDIQSAIYTEKKKKKSKESFWKKLFR